MYVWVLLHYNILTECPDTFIQTHYFYADLAALNATVWIVIETLVEFEV